MSLLTQTYVVDFECNNHEDDCRVWLWDSCDIYKFRHTYAYDIESFFDWLLSSNAQRVLYHNLGYDGAFLIDYLERSGSWLYRTKSKCHPQNHTYDIVKSRGGDLYGVTLYLDEGIQFNHKTGKFKCSRRRRIDVWDSNKVIPLSVAEIAEAFGTVFDKGEIDYNLRRPEGYIATDIELDYIIRDTSIVAEAIRIMYDMGLTHMTIGSDAINYFKENLPSQFKLDKLFPSSLWKNPDIDKFIRRAYRGGFIWLNELYKEKETGEGLVLDVNSMYSYQLKNMQLPYGEPEWFDGEYSYDSNMPLYIVEISISAKLKEGYIPCISSKGSYLHMDNDLVSECEDLNLVVTSIDLELILKSYDITSIAYYGGYKFKVTSGIFDNYINHWMGIKENSVGGRRLVAKLMLNNLIGKFGTNPNSVSRVPCMGSDGVISYKNSDEKSSLHPIYLPIPVFVNAAARKLDIETALMCGENAMYCDTDSVHINGSSIPDGILISDSKLGAWKVESKFCRGYYISPKRYVHEIQEEDGTLSIDVKCSGLSNKCKSQVTFENFRVGTKYSGKLSSIRVKGGVVLKECDFCIL